MNQKKKTLTILLPCAGEGSRLGLDQPKELYSLFPGVKLIDLSLHHIRLSMPGLESAGIGLQVAVIIRSHKSSVSLHVRQKLPEIPVYTVLFNDHFFEWPGSVYSAASHYSAFNVVLLPDSLVWLSQHDPFRFEDGTCLLEKFCQQLVLNEIVFGYISTIDPARLSKLGALHVTPFGSIDQFEDKPSAGLSHYNGFWTCYGFHQAHGKSLYRFLSDSVRHIKQSLFSCRLPELHAFEVFRYFDLGTWEDIALFKKSLFLEENLCRQIWEL